MSSNNFKGEFLAEDGGKYDRSMIMLIRRTIVQEDRDRMERSLSLCSIIEKLEKNEDIEYDFATKEQDGSSHSKKVWFCWIDRETKEIAMVSSDVTEENRKAEESREAMRAALRAAEQASAAKTDFLSRMSHDMRTPLNAIIGYTEMGLEDKSLSRVLRDQLSKVEASSRFLLSLINDILNMSRIESGKYVINEEPFRMRDFIGSISSIVSSQCDRKNIIYTCTLSENVHSEYTGDRLKLQQVLLNIIGNSVKFTSPGGRISLEISEKENGSRPLVTFRISDSGCGISEEFLPDIFDPFSQEKRFSDNEIKGSGLGLAICRSLVNMMNGSISVKSKVKEGSQFTVTLPMKISDEVSDITSEPETAAKYSTDPDFGGRPVLLAEDNELNMEIAKHILERAGLIVEYAENGKRACEMFEESQEGYYRAVIMDIRMPEMNGLEATKIIRGLSRSDSNVPIIAMSANAFEEDIRQALNCGMNSYAIKPIDVPQLYAILQEFIR